MLLKTKPLKADSKMVCVNKFFLSAILEIYIQISGDHDQRQSMATLNLQRSMARLFEYAGH